jgi:hypothetical protein
MYAAVKTTTLLDLTRAEMNTLILSWLDKDATVEKVETMILLTLDNQTLTIIEYEEEESC